MNRSFSWSGEQKRPAMLETPRLRLYPLSLGQLRRARFRLRTVAAELGLNMEPQSFAEWWQRRRIYGAKASLLQQNPRAWLLTTIWLIADRTENLLVGEIGFKGPPAAGHAVEVGYSTRKAYRGKGIMTEALRAMVEYVFWQHDYTVDYVTAFTKHGNIASRRVLQKNGFEIKPSYSPYVYWERGKISDETQDMQE